MTYLRHRRGGYAVPSPPAARLFLVQADFGRPTAVESVPLVLDREHMTITTR